MFRNTSHIQDDGLMLKLEECLTGPWVEELDACWREALRTHQNGWIRVEVRDVCHVDEAGRALMTVMYRAGARFVARGCVMPEVVREIAESVETHQAPRRAGVRVPTFNRRN